MEVEMVKVWIVRENMPGCLPESDPFLFDDKKDARECLREVEAELQEEDSDYYAFMDGPFWVHEEEWKKYQDWGMYPVLHTSEEEE
jgi:hypothetical protein